MMVFTIILFQGFIFTVLILLLRHFMKAHITGAVNHLQQLNEQLVKQQTELRQKNAEAQKEYESRLAKLQQEITARQAQVREEAAKTLDESRQRAKEEREKIINEAVETREKIRQEIMAEMETQAVQHSKKLVERFFSGKIHGLVHDCLVEEAVESLKEVDLERFQIQTDSGELKSANGLKPEIKKKIQQIIREKIKKEVHLKEEVDPSLLGGIILRIGNFVIDGSLTNRLQEEAVRLKKELARRYQANT